MTEVATLNRLNGRFGDRYHLVRELGHGGMAVVYLARDLRHDREVALKVMRPEIAAALGTDRFLREIHIAAQLQHPHILGLHDSGQVDGVLYYTMPYVEGETLRQRLDREGQLPLEEAVRLACQVASAMGHAHRHGVVHRDIKPANILLVGPEALVADFGLARALAEAGGDELTRSGMALGTPCYMSPEQASGDSRVDGRADVYALGCVVYEMIAGEPPFVGRTPQAILARQLQEEPRSLRVVRPTVPAALQAVIERALAKVPADRFATSDEFARAMEVAAATPDVRAPRASRRLAGLAAGVAVLGLALWGGWQLLNRGEPALDARRVLVFPLSDDDEPGAGEAVATYVGYALERAPELRWIDGWDWLSETERSAGAISATTARALGRRQRARYYIDGRILRSPDSITVVLRLHDILGDSIVARAGASAPGTEAAVPQLGLTAVGDLLPALLEPGREVDLGALAKRRPTAIAAFLQGEHAYRRANFSGALEHYRTAVREDSSLAIAALKGAQAANWRELNAEALQLADVALGSQAWLPPRYAGFALGFRDYLRGAGDSAVARLRRTVAGEPDWSEAWAALGEAYYHLLPSLGRADSLAEDAFVTSRELDSAFTPPLLHLAELALRRSDTIAAADLIRGYQRADPDSLVGARLDLMLSCVRGGPGAVHWSAPAWDRNQVLLAARLLSAGGAHLGCAEAGFRAVLADATADASHRWGALLGLQSALVAQGRASDVRELLDSPASTELSGPVLYLIDAPVEPALEARATEVARDFGEDYAALPGAILWALGTWAAHLRDVPALDRIVQALRAKRDSSGARADSLLERAMAARLGLARGDTAAALRDLGALSPNAPLADLEWQPWESLAGERLALAQVLLARGEYEAAEEVAARLEAPQPVIHTVFLPAALEIQEQAAAARGQARRAEALARRVRALR